MYLLLMSIRFLSSSSFITEDNVFERIPYDEDEVWCYGVVSYYGEKWNGRTTANMEIYDCELLTCASPSLPFNTIVEITNLDNNETIRVRVNDRGPFKMDTKGRALRPLEPHPVRVFDLSKASFDSLGNLDKGLLNIKYRIIKE